MSAPAISTWLGAGAPVFGAVLAARTVVETLIYVGAIILVTAIITLWLATSRQASDYSSRPHHASRSWLGSWLGKSGGAGKKRRRRRAHRKRNPTLAETGGLPPIRRESSTPADSNPP
jgi:hypothetical protein